MGLAFRECPEAVGSIANLGWGSPLIALWITRITACGKLSLTCAVAHSFRATGVAE